MAAAGRCGSNGKTPVRARSRRVSKTIPIDFAGAKLELRGFLRTEDVSDFAGLWMRQDDDAGSVAFDNMQRRQLKGTTEWTEYSIVLPLNGAAKRLVFGVLASGTRTSLGRRSSPARWTANRSRTSPAWNRPRPSWISDKEFDGGSGIALKDLTHDPDRQSRDAREGLGIPEVPPSRSSRSGKRQWDYELFRILPRVLAAADVPGRPIRHLSMVTGLGTVPPCSPCADPRRKRSSTCGRR